VPQGAVPEAAQTETAPTETAGPQNTEGEGGDVGDPAH
jgi:hypothetical protein